MKKNFLLLSAIMVLSMPAYAKAKPVTPATLVKPVAVVETKVVATVKEVELKPVKGKMVSQIGGTIVFESEIFDSVKVPGTKTDTVIGDIDTNGEDETLLGEKMPKGTVELGLKVYENYDIKLNLVASKSTAEDVSTLSISRTWADAYMEWKSEMNLGKDNLYQSLVPTSQIIVRKSKGRVEGQIKAGVKATTNELTGASEVNYGIDDKSQDTYIKIKVTPTSNVTLRPYDMDFTIGKRFENNNFDRKSEATLINNDKTTPGLADAFDNVISTGSDQRIQISGAEYENLMGKAKYYGKVNMFNLTDCLFTQLGVDYKINNNSKFTVASLIGLGINNFGSVNESDIDDDVVTNYFGLNAMGEHKTTTTLFEAEADIRSLTTSVTGDYKENDFMFGLYGKATFKQGSELRPYVYTKFLRKSVSEEDTNYTFKKPYNSFDLGGGVEKTIDGLTLTGDLLFNNSKEAEYKEVSSGTTVKAGEIDYGTRFVASFKAVYRF